MNNLLQKRTSLHKQFRQLQQENRDLRAQITSLQTLANVGSVCLMIAHEINNILTPLAGYAQFALANPDDRPLTAKALGRITRDTDRAQKIQQSLLALINGETEQKEPCPLKKMTDEIFSALARDFKKDRVKVNLDIPEDLTVHVVPVQFQQVIMNLILNAREAMLPAGGTLTINAGRSQQSIWLHISDTGCGLSQNALARIFEPFYSTKTPRSPAGRSGTGLGLAFCKQILDAHDAIISVESELGKGTTFKILLPNTESNPLRAAEPHLQPGSSSS